MNYDIITIGDIFEDNFMRPAEKHLDSQIKLSGRKLTLNHGDKILIDELTTDLGGSACNVAVGLSKFGFNSAILSLLGKDERAEKIERDLAAKQVETKFIRHIPKTTTNFSAILVYKKERTIFLYRGLDSSKIVIPKSLKTKWVYLGPVSEHFGQNYSQLITLAAEKNLQIAINPGHRQIIKSRSIMKKIIRVSEILILNKEEALDLTQSSPLMSEKNILTNLKNLGSKIVVMTDGENGAYVASCEGLYYIPVFKAEAVDPTGAGDAFSSAFISCYIKNNNIKDALQWGIVNSALVTESYGAQTNLQTQSQIEKLLKHAPKIIKI